MSSFGRSKANSWSGEGPVKNPAVTATTKLRFHDLEAALGGVAPNTLSARLKTLEKRGVIGTRLYEQHPPRFEYFLTDKGQALGPVLKALYNWGERYG
jgi:DNA-binding HxlR family transcriptional regulator